MRFRKLKKQSKQLDKIKKDLKQKYQYARYVDRIKALITDLFMIYAPILYTITYVIMNGKDDFQSSQLAPLAGVLLYGIIYALLLSRSAQTPGKKAYEMKVVDIKTGQNLSFFRAFYRFIAFLFSATILLGLFVPFYRKDNRALHDLIAGSVVVNTTT
jgi:uncharacterized RDD family membrane protein YckC